jgi:hypothetical protein
MEVPLPAFDIPCTLQSHGVVKEDGCAWLCDTVAHEQIIGEVSPFLTRLCETGDDEQISGEVSPLCSDASQADAGRLSEEESLQQQSLQAPFFNHFFGKRLDESNSALADTQKNLHKQEDQDGDESTTYDSSAEDPATSFCDAESSCQTMSRVASSQTMSRQTTPPTSFHGNTNSHALSPTLMGGLGAGLGAILSRMRH